MFVDRARITVKSGKGGNGSVSFRREPFVRKEVLTGETEERAGDVIFEANNSYRTLMDFRYKRKYEAPASEDGMKKKKYGKNGEDLVIMVPPGTMVIDELTGLVMKDLVRHGDRVVAVKGGKGGKGNVHFKNSVRQAPNFAGGRRRCQRARYRSGTEAHRRRGASGFPKRRKVHFLSVSTSAKPKIGNYHFTTITPNLGVVHLYDTSLSWRISPDWWRARMKAPVSVWIFSSMWNGRRFSFM